MNEQDFLTKYETLEERGEAFGYPTCCVTAFAGDIKMGLRPASRNIIVDGHRNCSGFIPCQKCKEKILAGETTLEGLIDYNKRVESLPRFQEDWVPVGENEY